MARKKKLFLVWQDSGSYDTYFNRLCGVFDSEEQAQELKAKLDGNVIDADNCWTVMPQDVYCQWPTVEVEGDSEYDFEYVAEYEGYTREQREEQEDRWYRMTEEYGYAQIEVVNMNDEL
jgi:hypothetical protein